MRSAKPAIYRGKEVRISGYALYTKKIMLVSGQIVGIGDAFAGATYRGSELVQNIDLDLNVQGKELWMSFGDRASDACYKQFVPVIQQWLNTFDINSLLVQARKAYIQDEIQRKQAEFDKLVKEASELENRINDLKYYDEV